ncbi:AttM family quorum-quenching N-acyl homoserine lactonase [Methylorubrum thiocyanatum]|uniref:Glyoxylase-like metal-dependent hydrolase (Beta-lactamase superfamily II) n=1 Tax=Methylorubrum thiocyanatum TaxID=47958 RepID=A0AA40VBQ6_9HYPH|nr:N-acyl homoserine lactonase family protein [Methylorubrum thiocyanatum]MBA8914519.1 glyoxylase-like metal-dependent hydrolase (beta-lactamase superfamily II) [Methylorubrum thiocyanatum]GJE82068.1 N-acyl homoserine lactonase AttM [Methylorubrum thiocyanatum]
MSDIQLHFFQTGSLGCRRQDIYMNQGLGEPFEIPVPWYLVAHPRGHVVIDGGFPAICATDPHGHWGPVAQVFEPRVAPGQDCAAQVRAAGFDPADVRTVLLSHLHLDHTGAIGVFPNARHVVQRAALDYALAPDWFCAAAFVRADFDRPGLDWCLLDEAWGDFFDLYGDGAITCLRSPGHTVGHQSFLVRTARGATLLAIDAADTMDHWEDRALPGAVTSVTEAVRSVAKLRAVAARAQARVVPGHDPVLWPTLAQSPAFY